MHAADRIDRRIDETGSCACVGLDPRPELLPPPLVEEVRAELGSGVDAVTEAFWRFNRTLIERLADRCAAIKPQAACYEAYGSAGWRALERTVAAAADAGVPVILDAKRGDIGSTARHYGEMAFGGAPDLDGGAVAGIGADWITANPYLGADGIAPLLETAGEGTGVFVLVKTSNPSGGDLQDRAVTGGGTVAECTAELVRNWGRDRVGTSGLSDIGAVVGATYPDDARRLREHMPDTLFLVPGYGAQGASANDAVAGRRADGRGVLVASSRAIIAAWREAGTDDWAGAASDALDRMHADLARALG